MDSPHHMVIKVELSDNLTGHAARGVGAMDRTVSYSVYVSQANEDRIKSLLWKCFLDAMKRLGA